MMEVVVVGTRPEGQDVLQRPGEVVPRMRVDGLKEPERDPDVHRDNVEVAPREVAQTQRTTKRAYGKNQGLGWMGVFSSKAEGCGVFVVQLVDVTVERTIVQCLMGCEWVIRRQISCRWLSSTDQRSDRRLQ